jgi:hypothetical protein
MFDAPQLTGRNQMARLQLTLGILLSCSAVAAAQQVRASGGLAGAMVDLPLPCSDNDPYCAYFPGRVGFGTLTPTQKVDVVNGYGTFTMPNGSATSAGIGIYQDDVAASQGRWLLFSRPAGHFAFYNIGTSKDVLGLLPSGNVGIGTTTPAQALELTRTNADVGLNFNSLDNGSSVASVSMGINQASGRAFYISRGSYPGQTLDFNIEPIAGAVGIGTTASTPYRLTLNGHLNVVGSGALYVNSGQVINSSGQWVGGAVTASGAVQGTSLTATGAVQAASVTATGTVQGASVTATGAVQGASVTATGTVQAASVTATGTGTVQGGLVRANGNLEVTNSGVVKVGGITVVNSTGHWVGPGIPVTNTFHVCVDLQDSPYVNCGCAHTLQGTSTTHTCTVGSDVGSCSAYGCQYPYPQCPQGIKYGHCCVCTQ